MSNVLDKEVIWGKKPRLSQLYDWLDDTCVLHWVDGLVLNASARRRMQIH